jgi:small subunit ribosomal protein S18
MPAFCSVVDEELEDLTVAQEQRSDMKSGQRAAFRRSRRKRCRLCSEKVRHVDYKDVAILKLFITDRGKILARRISGNCAKHQRLVTRAVKRARNIALLPFMTQQ